MRKIFHLKFVFTVIMAIILVTGCETASVKNNSISESSDESTKKCTMDIDCDTKQKCVQGVCTGGIVPDIMGECVEGDFGKSVCSNTGKECTNDSQCF